MASTVWRTTVRYGDSEAKILEGENTETASITQQTIHPVLFIVLPTNKSTILRPHVLFDTKNTDANGAFSVPVNIERADKR